MSDTDSAPVQAQGGPEHRTFLEKAHRPFLQVVVSAGLIVFFLGILQFVQPEGPGAFGQRLPWVVITAVMLLYALFNSIFCLASTHSTRYWNQSVLGYAVLAVFGGLLAWWDSGISIHEAGSFRWLFFVVSFAYLVFISIVNLIRIIVAFAQKEEWNAPRTRRR